MESKVRWYKKTVWIVAILILFFPVGIFLMWKYTRWPKIVKVVITCIFGFFLLASFSSRDEDKTESSQKVSNMTVSTTVSPQAEQPFAYEVIKENKNGTTDRVEVYTSETSNARLIKLNDLLIAKYGLGLTHLFIDYFDDKSAADGYFQKQLSDTLSESEKNQLYKHYIANMILNTTTGYKKLVRQGASQTILKEY